MRWFVADHTAEQRILQSTVSHLRLVDEGISNRILASESGWEQKNTGVGNVISQNAICIGLNCFVCFTCGMNFQITALEFISCEPQRSHLAVDPMQFISKAQRREWCRDG
jgi:hypothetical protein